MRGTLLSEPEKAHLRASAFHECTSHHKERPGDWGLNSPPSGTHPDKTLCEHAGVTSASRANELFAAAIEVGLVSEQTDSNDLPRRIWLRTDDGKVFEARAGGSRPGAYHGFPVLEHAPGRAEIEREWGALVCPEG